MIGSKTPIAIEECVFAAYMVCQNYAATSRSTGVPVKTVFSIVRRLAGDGLADVRMAFRADLAQEAWTKVGALIAVVDISKIAADGSARAVEIAARAADSLARVAAALESREDPKDAAPTVVHVFTGLPPSTETIHQEGGHSNPIVGCALCPVARA